MTSNDESFIGADITTADISINSLQLIYESKSGFCCIYSAIKDGKRVIIKALKPDYRHSSAHRRLLLKEFDIASGMRHPNIVETYELTQIPELGDAIIMELVNGLPLHSYLNSRPHLSKSEVHILLSQICSALSYIHSRGIVHRDLKPQNLLVDTTTQTIKIIDFGLAHGRNYVDFNFSGGSRGYSAPEQLDEMAAHDDPRSDIYSLGAIIKLVAPKGSRALTAIAGRCLSTDINGRPGSAAEVITLLNSTARSLRKKIVLSLAVICIIAATVFFKTKQSSQVETAGKIPEQVINISQANQLIHLVNEGKVSGADMAENEEGFAHYAAIWNDSVFQKTGQWLSVGFKGNSVYFYLVSNDKFPTATRDSIAEVAGFHQPKYYYYQGYWWYEPIDIDLFSMTFGDRPDFDAIKNRIEQFLTEINSINVLH